MGAMFSKMTKPMADMTLLSKVDPLFKKTHQPLLDAERNSRKNIMGTNTPDIIPARVSINTPSRSGASTSAFSQAAKTLLG